MTPTHLPTHPTVPELLASRAADQPGRLAFLLPGGRSMTFGEWDERSTVAAYGLLARGLRPGDRVGLLFGGEDWPDFAVAYCAIQKAGGAAVPLPAPQGQALRQAGEMLAHCRAAGLIHTGGPAPDAPWRTTLDELGQAAGAGTLPEVAAHDLAQILYTSGTTGTPKGVGASHANLTHGHRPHPRYRPLAHSEHFLHAFPIGTNAAQMMLVNALVARPTAVCLARFEARLWCRTVARHRIGTVFLVPSMAIDLVNSGELGRYDLSGVTLVSSSAAALPPAVAVALAAAFPGAIVVNAYTSTEAVPAETTMIVDPERPGSVGRPASPGDLRITLDGGVPAAPGEVGEVWLRAVADQRSYYGDPAASAAVFAAGWTRMGDLGYLDEDGYLFLVDRESDLIKSGGLKVSTLHVEAVLHEHPAVAQAAVLGVPHPTMGALVGAAVVLRAPADADEIRRYAAARLARHETPARLLVMDDLPRNATGKVVKPELRALFTAPPRNVPLRTEAEVTLGGLWTGLLKVGRVGADDDFFALGGDSLTATQLAAQVTETFGVTAPVSLAFDTPVLADQARWITTTQPPPDHDEPPRGGGRDGALGAAGEYWWRWLNETAEPRQMPPVHLAVRIRDDLDVAVLERALAEVVRRHDALRMVFSARAGVPVATVLDEIGPVLTTFAATGPDPESAARELATAFLRPAFDLAAGPLIRAAVVHIGPADQLFVVAVHHLVFDGTSAGVLLRELGLLYSAFRARHPSPLPAPPPGFAAHSAWERRRWPDTEPYWRRTLDGAPTTLAALPGRRTEVTICSGESLDVGLPAEVAAGLRTLGHEHRMTVSMTAAACWAATLAAWSGSTEMVLAQPVSGRSRPEFEGVVGCLFRWILLRVDLRADPSVRDLLHQVRAAVLAGTEHQFYEYDRFHRQVRYPAFFRFENWGHPPHFPGLDSEPFDVPLGPNMEWPLAPGDRDLHPPEILFSEAPDGSLSAALIYNRYAYDRPGIQRLGAAFVALTRGALADPDRRLSEL